MFPGTTAPSISASGTSAITTNAATLTVTTNEIATCKYDLTDKPYADMVNTMDGAASTSHLASLSGLVVDTPYVRIVRCRDTLLNTQTVGSTVSFRTTAAAGTGGGGGGGGGSGGSTTSSTTSSDSADSASDGDSSDSASDGGSSGPGAAASAGSATATGESPAIEVGLALNEPQEVDVGGETHTVTLLEVSEEEATILVESDPIQVTLFKDIAQDLDTDRDGKEDLRISYLGFIDGEARIKLQLIVKDFTLLWMAAVVALTLIFGMIGFWLHYRKVKKKKSNKRKK